MNRPAKILSHGSPRFRTSVCRFKFFFFTCHFSYVIRPVVVRLLVVDDSRRKTEEGGTVDLRITGRRSLQVRQKQNRGSHPLPDSRVHPSFLSLLSGAAFCLRCFLGGRSWRKWWYSSDKVSTEQGTEQDTDSVVGIPLMEVSLSTSFPLKPTDWRESRS